MKLANITYGLNLPYVMDHAIGAVVSDANLAGQEVTAFVRGVPIGKATIPAIERGRGEVVIPIEQFPWVGLPCEIRLEGQDGLDVAPILVLGRSEQIYRVAGPGVLQDVDVRIVEGLIKGTAVNRINGFNRPMLIGRVNGATLRPINVQPVRPLDDGGCLVSFSMNLERDDFSAEGVRYEVLFLPSMAPIWSTTLAPVDQVAPDVMVEVEERLAASERRAATSASRFVSRFESDLQKQNDVIENLTAYLSSLILDRINVASSAPEDANTIATTILATARSNAGSGATASHAVVGVDSPFLGGGWSQIYEDKRRLPIRWMASTATIFNPHPERQVASILLTIAETRGQTLSSDLTVLCDGQVAAVEIAPVNEAPCTITIVPPETDWVFLLALLVSPNANVEAVEKLALISAVFRYRD